VLHASCIPVDHNGKKISCEYVNGISSLVTAGLALIPGVGLFAVLGGSLVSIGVMELIDWAVEEYGWLDSIKDWIESW
jgi:hypothetical protein